MNRTLLDEAGGPNGVSKRFRGDTMLVTKNGMPRFITEVEGAANYIEALGWV